MNLFNIDNSLATPYSFQSNTTSVFIDNDWLAKQLENVQQIDYQNYNLPSNTDISEFVLQQSVGESPFIQQQKRDPVDFSLIKLEKLEEAQQINYTPKKQYTSATRKQNYKKCKTTTTGFAIDENDANKNDSDTLRKIKSSQVQKKSEFTKQLNIYQQNFSIQIQVKYFGTQYQQIISVDESIRAAEFIVLALKRFASDPKSDKSKFEYQNFSLAYKLVGQDLSPTKYTYNNDENFDNDSIILEEESLERPEIDLESQLFYKMVELLPTTTNFGLDFQTIKQTFISNPESIILLIEDPQSLIFYHIKVNKKGTLGDCLVELNRKVSKKYLKNDFYLSLKFSCVNYDFGELNEKFPINQLPIHWLVIIQKARNNLLDSQEEVSMANIGRTLNNTIHENMRGSNSCGFLSINFMQLATVEKLPLLYSYQEFNLIRAYKEQLIDVILGIDYFDLYYTFNQKQAKKVGITKLVSNLIKSLFVQETEKKKYKRIPINAITDLKQQEEKYFEIYYELQDGYQKTIKFFSKNDDKIVFRDAFTKLEYLVSIQQI
ncbi:unnamed protein product (macronuclear) [Paramecium tetraurelia]|uniref:Ubiquitin-like protease family profile domain-containing protein n=1 Tax=Paramecium tetraurelia TaxID=5888 RepID=A0ED19_PARTE|nr:uncharacterized protein GSPATT00004055001 [Paramecium tetraurelia]CAK93186.1 unnamed protein product [Paramecium tetraurelia]|eukprot:XP_001460583.1 hypothetical protein (macronuclear) [Paramecium tetraurelia strain d4-2]